MSTMSSGDRKVILTYGSRKSSASRRVNSDFEALLDDAAPAVPTRKTSWAYATLLEGLPAEATGTPARTPLSDISNHKGVLPIEKSESAVPRIRHKNLPKDQIPALDPTQALLNLAGQTSPTPFENLFAQGLPDSISKIGEASYSEVFVFTTKDDSPVVKIIPLSSSANEGSRMADVVREATLSMQLTPLAHFTKFHQLKVVQGSFIAPLLRAWDQYDKQRKETLGLGSENSHPSRYGKDQLYALFYLDYAGIDLETYPLASWTQSFEVLRQVVEALAKAEELCRFEHRDLHWGNILIKLGDGALTASIIDFTLSRMQLPGQEPIFHGFEDETLFLGRGDHQFEVYRAMRECVGDDWKGFHPMTNVMWIEHLVLKLLHDKDLRKPGHRASARTKQRQVDNLASQLDALNLLHTSTTSQFRIYGAIDGNSEIEQADEIAAHETMCKLATLLKEALAQAKERSPVIVPAIQSAADVWNWLKRSDRRN